MERQQATPGGLDETISAPREDGFERLALDGELNQMEGWRLRLEASGVPELQPTADRLARLQDNLRSDGVNLGEQVRGLASTEVGHGISDRLEALAGLLEREGRRPADARA